MAVLLLGGFEAIAVDFQRDVEPLLRRHCYRCHAGNNVEAGLRLDHAAGLLGRADTDEPIVVAHQPGESWLLTRMTDEDEGDLMPLDGEPLESSDLEIIRAWIAEGAAVDPEWSTQTHWAYVPPTRPPIPDSTPGTSKSPIDQFVLDRLRREGMSMNRPADPATLARRVSLALTGLPATPQQIAAFQNDSSPRAYELLVDQLLASSDFGQNWARHWLDLARYADSNGFQADQLRDAWAYRDWVVDAFSDDMPFDRFVVEQLAGDLLPDASVSNRIATGFHRTPTCNVEAGVHPEANRVNQVFDRVNTTATVFLGTTLECAQCHDHKYDPFTQNDYYRMFAYFNNTPLEVEKVAGVTYDFVGPKMALPLMPEEQEEARRLRRRRLALNKKREARIEQLDIDGWIAAVRESLPTARPTWVTPPMDLDVDTDPDVRSKANDGPSYGSETLPDGSVLLTGPVPDKAVYQFTISDWHPDTDGRVLGMRVDALQDESLPGQGPGRGDPERTNFVLNEVELMVQRDGQRRPLRFAGATASFSQLKYDVANVIDGDPKTAWAISPKFDQSHWAELILSDPVDVDDRQTFVVKLSQQFGRGRVIGRPKVSFLVGSPESLGLSEEMVGWLSQSEPLTKQQHRALTDLRASKDDTIVLLDEEIATLTAALDAIEPSTTLVMTEQDEPRETFLMQRGDYLSPGSRVDAGTPASLHASESSLPPNRLGLATWITDPANPLLARVTVNRFWMQVFGRGIVTTPEDFGTQSEPPSHPELLDWLAIEFQSNGWSVKQLLKSIVMSSTFRQDSSATPSDWDVDPDNRWLARGPRYRLPAEAIRDNALAVAGLLSPCDGGAPIMPYQPDGIWRAVGRNQPKWKAADDDQRYRRGIYVVWKRAAPYPSFVTFDAPDRASCTVRRPRTNTPLQALVLLNDRSFAEAAVGLAMRMMRESVSPDPASIAATGYGLATGGDADDSLTTILVDLYEDERNRIQADRKLIDMRLSLLPSRFHDASLDRDEVAAWFAVASTLLNLDATITLH
ncbi:MAG: PSD1 and planctomycete cytochrome C domain-containing protein [Planctomycetota bacterium]